MKNSRLTTTVASLGWIESSALTMPPAVFNLAELGYALWAVLGFIAQRKYLDKKATLGRMGWLSFRDGL
ncbi:MAG: hypothetical protein IIC78_12745 [Chloroflexi bacterium]|nr:hypothetical protein [Chloroflexota bacterium]